MPAGMSRLCCGSTTTQEVGGGGALDEALDVLDGDALRRKTRCLENRGDQCGGKVGINTCGVPSIW